MTLVITKLLPLAALLALFAYWSSQCFVRPDMPLTGYLLAVWSGVCFLFLANALFAN